MPATSSDDPRDAPAPPDEIVTVILRGDKKVERALQAQARKVADIILEDVRKKCGLPDAIAPKVSIDGRYHGGGCKCHGGRMVLKMSVTVAWGDEHMPEAAGAHEP